MSPTILRTKNLQIRVYPKDHAPPHVHVVGPEAEAKIRLDDLSCISSKGFSINSLNRIVNFIRHHKQVLLEAWDEYQEG